MNNAEYVKSLGLEFKDLTTKIEDYSEADKVYTWGVLNKKTNKRIGSYHSFDKKDFPVVPVIIGEWLLQEDAYAKDQFNKNKDSKALLRYALNKIAREFVNDTSISGKFLCKNQYAYFNNLQSYVDRVNKLFGGKDLCDTFHAPFLNEERKEIYIVYDSKRYTLGSACGEKREVHYDEINEIVDKYMNKESELVLKNGLTLIVMAFVYDVMTFIYDGADNVAIDRQVYIDKVNKLVGRDICDTSHIVNPDGESIGIYVEWLGKTYLLGSVDISTDFNSMKKTIYYDRIEAFVNAYMEDIANE